MSVGPCAIDERDLIETTSIAINIASGLADHITVSGDLTGRGAGGLGGQYRHITILRECASSNGFSFLPMRLTG